MFQPAPAGIVDRAAEEREQSDLLERALADPRTRVLLIDGDAAPRATDGLGWLSPDDVAALVTSPVGWAFLGRDDEGSAVLVAAARGRERQALDLGDGWALLRETATSLPAPIADLFTVAVSLGRFLSERFCSRCGTEAPLATSGWSRLPRVRRRTFPPNRSRRHRRDGEPRRRATAAGGERRMERADVLVLRGLRRGRRVALRRRCIASCSRKRACA